eukprot:403376766
MVLCCAGSAACCAGQICCKSLCCLCDSCGINPKNFPKVTYVLFNTFWMGISIILMFTLGPLFEKFDYLLECNEESGGGSACFGTGAVLRMSFVLFIFHMIVLLTILPRISCSSIFHDGCWFFKFLFVIGLYIAVFWIPDNFYWGWAHLARIVSGLYLIIQVILLITVAYTLNDKMVSHYENGNTCLGITLVGSTVIITCGTIAFTVMKYVWFHGCGGTIGITTYTLVVCILFYVLVLLRTRKDASIFTSSIVSAYITYLSWSAQASLPDEECNPFLTDGGNLAAQILVGGFFTFSSLLGISLMSNDAKDVKGSEEQKIGQGAKYIIAEDTEESNPNNLSSIEVNGQQKTAEELAIFPVTRATIVFQIIMLIATLYYPMLITNWGDPQINNDRSNFFQANWISFWVKLTSQWICIILYTFSLVAPLICKGRDFY